MSIISVTAPQRRIGDTMDRDRVVWYYRLGGQTLGPVPWTEIEQLTRDTTDATDLLVAQGGDEQWRSAADVLEEHPDLVEEKEPEPEPASEEFESLVEGPGDATALSVEPSAAAQEVLDEAATRRDTGRAAPPAAAAVAGDGFAPEHGLGNWLNQAWTMTIDEIWPWIGAQLLMVGVAMITLGLAVPPLFAGLHMTALKRFRGEKIRSRDVFDGFGQTLEAWGLSLVMMVPAVLLLAPMMILVAVPAMQAEMGASPDEIGMAIGVGAQLLFPVLWALILGVQTIFFYSWPLVADGYGAWESVTRSWEKVRDDFWSHLGLWLILSIISSLGAYICSVGQLLTYPLLPCAQVAAYRWHFRRAR
jgi:hypothetical protein